MPTMTLPFAPPWLQPTQPPAQAVNLSIGSMSAEAAILQRLPPQALLTVLENGNKLALKQLENQDRQIATTVTLEDKHKQRLHDRAIARDRTHAGRWDKLYGLVIVLCVAVLFGSWQLYRDGHVEVAVGLIGTMLTFAAGFAAGKGYEQARQDKNGHA
jgi:hypothetical protein